NAWKRNISPMTNPTSPEKRSAWNASGDTLRSLNPFVMKKFMIVMMNNEMTSLIRLSTSEPTFFPEYSKDTEDPTQQKAVNNAAISPMNMFNPSRLIIFLHFNILSQLQRFS